MGVLTDFLQSREWRKVIQEFVDGHCSLFEEDVAGGENTSTTSEFEYSIGQMEVYNEFTGIVNALLENVVGEHADDVHAFAQSLEEFASKDPSGPRESRVQDLVNTLLTFDSFETFALVMRARCRQMLSAGELSNYVDAAKRLEASASSRKTPVVLRTKAQLQQQHKTTPPVGIYTDIYTYIYIYLYIYLFIYLSIYIFIYLSIYIFIYLSIYMSAPYRKGDPHHV